MSILTVPKDLEFDYFNSRFPDLENYGELQSKAFWLPTDVSYANDGKTFETLDENVQNMVKMTVGFFSASDGIVFDNIASNFKEEIKTPEVQYAYTAIEHIELIHAKSYGRQLHAIINDPTERKMLMRAIDNIPSIKKMADWAREYTDRNNYTLLERLMAFLCIEGIFFSSPFAFIFWVRKYHPTKIEGIVAANDLISRDENLHCEFAVKLITTLYNEGMNTPRGVEIFKSAVDVVLNFVRDTLKEDFLNMNTDIMSSHVKFVANRWASMINLPVIYPDCLQTPFPFMEMLSLEVKKNFFEKDATEYQKAPPMESLKFNDTEGDW